MKTLSPALLALSVTSGLLWLLYVAVHGLLLLLSLDGPTAAGLPWLTLLGGALVPIGLFAAARQTAAPRSAPTPDRTGMVWLMLGGATSVLWIAGALAGLAMALVVASSGTFVGGGALLVTLALTALVPIVLLTTGIQMRR